jgi:hypothetical protein
MVCGNVIDLTDRIRRRSSSRTTRSCPFLQGPYLRVPYDAAVDDLLQRNRFKEAGLAEPPVPPGGRTSLPLRGLKLTRTRTAT